MKRAALILMILLSPAVYCGASWEGVDKSVVERVAAEHGKEASAPLVNTDRGDLLLFVFLMAGAVAGFIAGYSYRMITAEKRKTRR